MTTRRRPALEWVAAAMCLSLCLPPSLALAWQSSNSKNRVGVYDIQNYALQYDAATGGSDPWKGAIGVSNTDMQAVMLYDSFNCSDSNLCGYNTSFRRYDSGVSVTNMNSSSGSYNVGKANLLFFYGHNIAPRVYDALYADHPLGPMHHFGAWFPAGTVTSTPGVTWGPINGSWQQYSLCSGHPADTGCYRTVFDWAISYTPYYYHWTNSQNGQYGIYYAGWVSPAYSVFYAYNPLTSMLIGQDWASSSWPYTNTVGRTTPSGYGSNKIGSSSSNSSTNFFVANGCEALPVIGWANHYPVGDAIWIMQGINAWKPSWGSKLHAVMGHSEGTRVDNLPSMSSFSYLMKMGMGVIQSYFLAHAQVWADPLNALEYGPSAIAPRATVGGQDVYAYDRWYPRSAAPTSGEISGSHYKAWMLLPGWSEPINYQW